MKVELLEESVIYQDVLNKGRNEGMEKGMEESIIYILSTRFNNISQNLIDLIYRTKDESQLYKFLELAVKSNSLSEFEKKIDNI